MIKCEHCDFKSKNIQGLMYHTNAKHKDVNKDNIKYNYYKSIFDVENIIDLYINKEKSLPEIKESEGANFDIVKFILEYNGLN